MLHGVEIRKFCKCVLCLGRKAALAPLLSSLAPHTLDLRNPRPFSGSCLLTYPSQLSWLALAWSTRCQLPAEPSLFLSQENTLFLSPHCVEKQVFLASIPKICFISLVTKQVTATLIFCSVIISPHCPVWHWRMNHIKWRNCNHTLP